MWYVVCSEWFSDVCCYWVLCNGPVSGFDQTFSFPLEKQIFHKEVRLDFRLECLWLFIRQEMVKSSQFHLYTPISQITNLPQRASQSLQHTLSLDLDSDEDKLFTFSPLTGKEIEETSG